MIYSDLIKGWKSRHAVFIISFLFVRTKTLWCIWKDGGVLFRFTLVTYKRNTWVIVVRKNEWNFRMEWNNVWMKTKLCYEHDSKIQIRNRTAYKHFFIYFATILIIANKEINWSKTLSFILAMFIGQYYCKYIYDSLKRKNLISCQFSVPEKGKSKEKHTFEFNKVFLFYCKRRAFLYDGGIKYVKEMFKLFLDRFYIANYLYISTSNKISPRTFIFLRLIDAFLTKHWLFLWWNLFIP